jgi:tetratricopeptide (TPR) repeat protein
MKKEYGKAIADFTEAIGRDPQNATCYRWRGSAWIEGMEYEKAVSDFNEALRLDPNDANAYLNRGAAWVRKLAYDEAITDFSRAIGLDPGNAEHYVWRGYAWVAKGEPQRMNPTRPGPISTKRFGSTPISLPLMSAVATCGKQRITLMRR